MASKMTRTELKAAILQATPNAVFHEADGLGTPNPKYRVELTLPTDDLPKIEVFSRSIGRRCYGISVLCNYNRSYRCINVKP